MGPVKGKPGILTVLGGKQNTYIVHFSSTPEKKSTYYTNWESNFKPKPSKTASGRKLKRLRSEFEFTKRDKRKSQCILVVGNTYKHIVNNRIGYCQNKTKQYNIGH